MNVPVLPEWSPIHFYKGYYSGPDSPETATACKGQEQIASSVHQCVGSCHVQGHNHNEARLSKVPVKNYAAFWGVLGCSCFAFNRYFQ
jgi:hypothetical protein